MKARVVGLKKIFFIGNARDYHAIHRYRMAKEVCGSREIFFVTDLIDGEGFEKLINEDDRIIKLFNIDCLLFQNQSKYGNKWRNFIKLVFFPVQARCLKEIAKNNPNSVFHAAPMYYMFLCWIARIPYIGTPQGSEILIRPDRSKLYKYFAIKSLLTARHVIVDSVNMRDKILQLCGKEATVIQNGIDIAAISRAVKNSYKREHIVSIRGFTPLYRINEIFDGREHSLQKPRLHFIYPFKESVYREKVAKRFEQGDFDMGRLSKTRMYELLVSSKLAISIPMSDSSPRSVYEAIFCGCCVAVTYNPWINAIPDCMKARLFIANLEDELWLERALESADSITKVPYTPSEAALKLFDQRKAMQIISDKYY